ncbi:hypothetical protein K3X41_00870 [Aliiroseovarius crassostreae]|uniref:hypothetical protein n=1 Tax=Aliiroseovarius crassostreae TaxID=154981 RepID=UPI00220C2338|nr:hypothetical protein [Aliiroseovarius crassostreae]UWQ08184.1 hypothetical protein K3X25_00860 [Aliiroseovarius crassostreae]UWQ11288.1 hypothetical protein K3X41_00870 [Aliiroseovarius crassostreae]
MFFKAPLRASLTLALVVLISLLQAPAANSGAWPREKGTFFVAMSGSQEWGNWLTYPTLSTYLEYGLTDQWTLGGKVEGNIYVDYSNYTGMEMSISDAEVFARWHFPPGGIWQKALGFTLADLQEDHLTFVPSFHIGRGFETRFGGGWLDASARIELAAEGKGTAFGVIAQAGLKPHDRFLTMMSVDAFADPHNVYVKLLPSVAWEYSAGRHVQVEWSEEVAPQSSGKLNIGIWMEF